MEKSVARVLIKNHHDKKTDLVSRPLVRAFNKIKSNGVSNFITDGGIYLYGCLEDGVFYEIFSQLPIKVNNLEYEMVPSSELLNNIKGLSQDEIRKIYSLIKKLVFGENVSIDFVEISTKEECASDRALLFKEYNNDLSYINPYERNHENDYNLSLIERIKIEEDKALAIKESAVRRR